MTDTTYILPPYFRARPARLSSPPLGAIAIGDARSEHAVSMHLAPTVERAPWCVPCVIVSPLTVDPAILSALHALPGHPVFIREPSLADDLPVLAVSAVRRRSAPTGRQMADYVTQRTGRWGLTGLLTSMLSAAADPAAGARLPDRTARDRMRRFGSLTPRCWRTIGNLARIAAAVTDASVDVMAWRAGVGPRTLRSWSARYLRTTLQEFRIRVGWEWVLEAALRVGGYVQAEVAASAAPDTSRAGMPPSVRTGLTWRPVRPSRLSTTTAAGRPAAQDAAAVNGRHPTLVDD